MNVVKKVVGTNAAITVLLLIAYWTLSRYESMIIIFGAVVFILYTLLCFVLSLVYYLSEKTEEVLRKKYVLGYLISAFVVSIGFILPWLLLVLTWGMF